MRKPEKPDYQKSGIIDVGGGMRGIYAAGAFDRCIDDGIVFDLAIGISAGSANVASYVSGQRGRNIAFYADYTQRPEYMSARNFIHDGSYLNMDYIYGTLSNEDGENPFDYDAFVASPTEVLVGTCVAETGETHYFTKSDFKRNEYKPMMASSSIPFVCKPYTIDGVDYYDGALGDTVPLEKAYEWGCTKVVLVLTKPADSLRKAGKDVVLARMIQGRYPEAAERLYKRAERYNFGVELAKALEEDGLCLVLAPDDTCGVDTLTKDPVAMMELYAKGYDDAGKIKGFLGK